MTQKEVNNKLQDLSNILDDLLNYFNIKGNKADAEQDRKTSEIITKAQVLKSWARQ